MTDHAADLMGFIDASPTPQHAAHNAAARLLDAGFEEFDPSGAAEPGARFVLRDGAVCAWFDGPGTGPLRMIGAHTDSPNLRIRPRPDTGQAGMRQLRVEVYGGALLNSWLDRDLGLAGRVVLADGTRGEVEQLYRSQGALLRVPQLAIHLDREIGDRGLQLDRQVHMTPVWGLGTSRENDFRDWLAGELGVAPDDVLGWDLACFDVQPSARLGADAELIAAPRLDNLCSVFGALEALIALRWSGGGPAAILLHDHEEVGSTTATGASSTWVAQVLEQRSLALGLDRAAHLEQLGGSLLASADMAHATHPNHTGRHEPGHWIRLGGGPVIKHNVNARYATDAPGAAAFRRACREADVEVQEYSHRGDLPCGSTIGPLAAAQLSVRTVDVGMPQLSMHSARELMAVEDVAAMVAAYSSWLAPGTPASAG